MEKNTNKLHYIKPCIEEWESAHNRCRQYEVKLVGHTRLTHGHLMSKNNHQPICSNTTCGKQTLTMKDYSQYDKVTNIINKK